MSGTTQRGANHAHSVWRDPTADFGQDVPRSIARRTTPDPKIPRGNRDLTWLRRDQVRRRCRRAG